MSLLLAEGHAAANEYTLVHVWNEARIVRQRFFFRRQRDNVAMQMVIGSVFDKKAGAQLKKLLNRTSESD